MAELASLTFPRYRALLDGADDRVTPMVAEDCGLSASKHCRHAHYADFCDITL